MRNINCGHKSHKQPIYSMVQLIKGLCFEFRHQNNSNKKDKEKFEGMWDSITQQEGSLTNHPGLITSRALELVKTNVCITADADDAAVATTQIENEIKACFMLSGT